MLKSKNARLVTASLVAIMAMLSLAAPSAQAADRDGVINSPEFGFYYNSSQYGYGSLSDFKYSQANLAGYKFLSKASGQGQYVKNNAAAVYNSSYIKATVFYNSNFSGTKDNIDPRWKGNLITALKNENASFWFYG